MGQPELEVVEPPAPARVRRPADAIRLIVAVLTIVVTIAIADVAVGTADALEGDLSVVTGGFPRILLTLLGWAAGLGVLALPVAVGADLVARGRLRQLGEAAAAATIAAVVVIGLEWLISSGDAGKALGALTRPLASGRTEPLDVVLVVLVAFLTVCRVVGRRWHQLAAAVVVGSMLVTSFLDGISTVLALGISLLLGWAVGLAVRVVLGAVPTLPDGRAIATALITAGLPIVRFERRPESPSGERRYTAQLAAQPDGARPGEAVEVQVVDRDTFGIMTIRDVLQRLRLRGASVRTPSMTVRAEIEHRALMSMTHEHLGTMAPRLRAAVPVGAYSAAIALTPVVGTTIALADDLTDEQVEAVWRLVATMQTARVAVRGLGPASLLVEPQVGLTAMGDGDISADELALRVDLAQAAVSLALRAGAARSIDIGVAVLGPAAMTRAMPLVQRLALDQSTKAELRRRRSAERSDDLLDEIRDRIAALTPGEADPESVELRRVTGRTLLTVVGGGVAAYLLLSMLAKVDVARLVTEANWAWALACVGCAIVTFAGPSLSITGAVGTRLSFVRTYLTQLAVAFSGLVAPGAVGNLALNTRYLVRSGIRPAMAGVVVGIVQLVQMFSYVLLLVATTVLAGTGTSASFTPPQWLVVAIPVVVLAGLALFAVPKVRVMVRQRVVPQFRLVGPQIIKVFQRPDRISRMVVGSLLLDLAFVGALVCATRAFGATPPIASVAVVYFAGAIIGSAVPTPGGLGGIEAALSAGLVAVGVDAGVAVSAVLLYRLATYWLPIPFGWAALNHLQKLEAI